MKKNLPIILFIMLILVACGTSDDSKKTLSQLADSENSREVVEEVTQEEKAEIETEIEIDAREEGVETVSTELGTTETKTSDVNTETDKSNGKETKTTVKVSTKEANTTETKEQANSTEKAPSKTEANEKTDNSSTPKEEKKDEVEKTTETVVEEKKEEEEVTVAKVPVEATGKPTMIYWDDFFDGVDLTKPSLKFQKLNGKKVELVGYMGEVLDFGGGWFLLIEVDGGDCPFCSADESYWNKVIVIYAKNKDYIRNIPGKVKVSGTLDVGIQKDGTGYKTMFRLYHAEFSSAK